MLKDNLYKYTGDRGQSPSTHWEVLVAGQPSPDWLNLWSPVKVLVRFGVTRHTSIYHAGHGKPSNKGKQIHVIFLYRAAGKFHFEKERKIIKQQKWKRRQKKIFIQRISFLFIRYWYLCWNLSDILTASMVMMCNRIMCRDAQSFNGVTPEMLIYKMNLSHNMLKCEDSLSGLMLLGLVDRWRQAFCLLFRL